MNYQKIHDSIIHRARNRELSKPYERHHVVPKCFGGSNHKDNIVHLTFREHFLVHWLLTKITTGKDKAKMKTALHCLTNKMSVNAKRIISSWQYDLAKKDFSKNIKGENNGMWGKKGPSHPAFGRRGALCAMSRKTGILNHMFGRRGKDAPCFGKTGLQNGASKPVIEITTGKTYESIRIAAKELNLNPVMISRVCKGKALHTKNYLFKYGVSSNEEASACKSAR